MQRRLLQFMSCKQINLLKLNKMFFFIKSQKEEDLSKNIAVLPEKNPSKKLLSLNNEDFSHNKKNSQSNFNKDTIKDTTIDSIENSYKFTSNNNLHNKTLSESQQIGTIYTIDEKNDKYKNLENPFTIPEIPRNPANERRSKIIHRINKERMNHFSKSVDNIKYKFNYNERRNSRLSNHLIDDD